MTILETDRLVIRKFEPDDLAALIAFRTDPRVSKYLGGAKIQNPDSLKERLRFYIDCCDTHGFGMSAAIWKETGELIGACGLQPLENTGETEVGYSFAYPFWGKGLATECAKAWLRLGFTKFELPRIAAVAQTGNSASQNVMKKLGMRFVKNAGHYGLNCAYYLVEREEFLQRFGGENE